MKIAVGTPPNWEKIIKVFPSVEKMPNLVVTYGETIFFPGGNITMSPDLQQHELVHTLQQKAMGIEIWWDKYLEDPVFRVEQEVQAYHVQYNKIKSSSKDRNWVFENLKRLGRDLSSPQYGSAIGFLEAMNRIRQGK